MHGPRRLHARSQRGADFHRQQSSMLIAMLHRLCQRDGCRDHPRGASPLACPLTLAIRSYQNASIAMPSIAEPAQLSPVGPLHGGGHRLLDQTLAHRSGGAGDHEATVPILDQASPPFSLVRLSLCAVFFWTNDQNSSIST